MAPRLPGDPPNPGSQWNPSVPLPSVAIVLRCKGCNQKFVTREQHPSARLGMCRYCAPPEWYAEYIPRGRWRADG
ncbi:hypothetical protein GRX01_06575 [Halobaculum sp. WSA2]|uniref:Uncharacterized protein n=1 Tax=Halobaculum saliterrae TaxID=2073113 RepID=A0A6B0SQT0_9EURY|nr:hypothetical protein [Halobaculum saliterrae]MXR41005.1 hypothetical protein [Halobaculum saliterrae]